MLTAANDNAQSDAPRYGLTLDAVARKHSRRRRRRATANLEAIAVRYRDRSNTP
jgi:hypothetical protein